MLYGTHPVRLNPSQKGLGMSAVASIIFNVSSTIMGEEGFEFSKKVENFRTLERFWVFVY